MAGAVAVRESVTIAGLPERVAVARAFAAAVLGQEHRERDTAVLLLSELVTNSVRHSGSRPPGQTITVTVPSDGKVIRVEVTDSSGTAVPSAAVRRRRG
jgi:anti-sigma regulatory factor (Ser/Thr protein kinase)